MGDSLGRNKMDELEQRIAKMISEGGLGVETYYNYGRFGMRKNEGSKKDITDTDDGDEEGLYIRTEIERGIIS